MEKNHWMTELILNLSHSIKHRKISIFYANTILYKTERLFQHNALAATVRPDGADALRFRQAIAERA